MPISIRLARHQDSAALREIETAAGEQFRSIGMSDVADHPPPGLDVLAAYADAGRSWVARLGGDSQQDDRHDDNYAGSTGVSEVVGFILVDLLDGLAHVEQVSVHPDHQGKGVGRALIDRVEVWATSIGCDAITLSTFIHVPWNAPLYRHLGFRELSELKLGPQLRARIRAESEHGLDPQSRVCMLRRVVPGP